FRLGGRRLRGRGLGRLRLEDVISLGFGRSLRRDAHRRGRGRSRRIVLREGDEGRGEQHAAKSAKEWGTKGSHQTTILPARASGGKPAKIAHRSLNNNFEYPQRGNQPPKYARRTSSDASSSRAGPARTSRPVSSTTP